MDTLTDIAIARLEDRGEIEHPTCAWCFRTIGPDEDEVEVQDEDTVEHACCSFQRLDEEELREYIQQIARDCRMKIEDYKDTHKSRMLEHHAYSLLARLNAIIAAAVR